MRISDIGTLRKVLIEQYEDEAKSAWKCLKEADEQLGKLRPDRAQEALDAGGVNFIAAEVYESLLCRLGHPNLKKIKQEVQDLSDYIDSLLERIQEMEEEEVS